MSPVLLAITALIYLYIGVEQLTKGNWPVGGMFLCYGLANLFLLKSLA